MATRHSGAALTLDMLKTCGRAAAKQDVRINALFLEDCTIERRFNLINSGTHSSSNVTASNAPPPPLLPDVVPPLAVPVPDAA